MGGRGTGAGGLDHQVDGGGEVLNTPAADLPAVPITLTTVDGTIRQRGT